MCECRSSHQAPGSAPWAFLPECNLWQKWISRSAVHPHQNGKAPQPPSPSPPYPEVGESTGPDIVFSQPADLSARLEALERKFNGHDTSLKILVRAVLGCGMLQGDEVYSALELKKIIQASAAGLEKALLMTAILTGRAKCATVAGCESQERNYYRQPILDPTKGRPKTRAPKDKECLSDSQNSA